MPSGRRVDVRKLRPGPAPLSSACAPAETPSSCSCAPRALFQAPISLLVLDANLNTRIIAGIVS
eukprot:384987-Rhodomonas_salina.1